MIIWFPAGELNKQEGLVVGRGNGGRPGLCGRDMSKERRTAGSPLVPGCHQLTKLPSWCQLRRAPGLTGHPKSTNVSLGPPFNLPLGDCLCCNAQWPLNTLRLPMAVHPEQAMLFCSGNPLEAFLLTSPHRFHPYSL